MPNQYPEIDAQSFEVVVTPLTVVEDEHERCSSAEAGGAAMARTPTAASVSIPLLRTDFVCMVFSLRGGNRFQLRQRAADAADADM
ncbi:MAG: hypothetical protein ACRCYR_19500 [Phycicoccus sp.]